MFEENKDRRSSPRFKVSLPLVLTFQDPKSNRVREEGTVTRDASASGIYFYSETELTQDADFQITLFLEPGALRVRYKARVVRVERGIESGYGVAAITKFESFLTEA